MRRAFCHVHGRNIDEDPSGEATQSVFRQRRVYIISRKCVVISSPARVHTGVASVNVKVLNAKIVPEACDLLSSLLS